MPNQQPAPTATTDPEATARAWLRVTQSVSYADPRPSAWIDRARSVVTDGLAAEYDRYRDGGAGAAWPGFVDDRCVSTVTDVASTVPAEAPRSDVVVNVQVAGRLLTRCQHGDPAARPDKDLAATLTLVRGRDGRWRVDQQIY